MDFEDRFHVKTFSKNNMNSSQSTEQSQATSVDSTKVDVDYK